MHSDINTISVQPDSTVGEAMARMDKARLGAILVVDSSRTLLGIITDGDVRRAILANRSLSDSVQNVLQHKIGSQYAVPIVASIGDDRKKCFRLLQENNVLHLPVLDFDRKVVGLITMDDYVSNRWQPIQAVIMAGGKGSRLFPLTQKTPKPMLQVGNRPLLEIIIEQLRDIGVQRVNLTTHHNGNKISDYFGDGKNFGVELNYVAEDRPLGTAGGLCLLEPPNDTMLVINGDILTQVDFKAMLDFHHLHNADITVGVKQYEVEVPFGVVECEGSIVRGISEKPALNLFVNGGIYLLEPMVYQYLPNGEVYHMTDLIQNLLRNGGKVASFPIHEYWLDVGSPEDYEEAQTYIKSVKPQL